MRLLLGCIVGVLALGFTPACGDDAGSGDGGEASDAQLAADAALDGSLEADAALCEPFSDPTSPVEENCGNGSSPTAKGDAPGMGQIGVLQVVQNLTYGKRGGRSLQGDLYIPPIGKDKPGLLLVIHGGGWQDCDRRRDAMNSISVFYASVLGVPVFNIEYRLSQEGGVYPEGFRDVNCAMQWIASQAETYGFDGERIAVMGESAGGHLALLSTTHSLREDLDPECGPALSPALVVSYSGPTDLPDLVANPGPLDVGPAAKAYTLSECEEEIGVCAASRACEACVDASPRYGACEAQSRIVLVQAPDPWDSLVPEAQAIGMRDALESAGKEVRLIMPEASAFEAEEECTQGLAHGLVSCMNELTGGEVAEEIAAAIGAGD